MKERIELRRAAHECSHRTQLWSMVRGFSLIMCNLSLVFGIIRASGNPAEWQGWAIIACSGIFWYAYQRATVVFLNWMFSGLIYHLQLRNVQMTEFNDFMREIDELDNKIMGGDE